MKVLVLNGPNLNLLGSREPQIYGGETLASIDARLIDFFSQHQIECECYQSNAEHELVDKIQSALQDNVDYMIVNPAAFTHTSVAIRDAIAAVNIPFIEVHLSNPHSREPFRAHSYFSDIAQGVICGFGAAGYEMAAERVSKALQKY